MTVTVEQIERIREDRASLWSQMEQILDEAQRSGEDLSGDQLDRYTKLERDLDAKHAEVEVLERHRSRELELASTVEMTPDGRLSDDPAERDTQLRKAYDSFLRHGISGLTDDERQLMQARYVPGHNIGQSGGSEARAQATTPDAAGGYLVPEGFWNRIQETLLAYGNVQDVSNVISTETGNDLPWPTNDDTANEGEILGENTQIVEQDLTLGVKTLGAYKYTSKSIRVSWELLQDNAFNLEQFIARKFGERLGRIYNRHQTLGTGTNQPDGVAVGTTTGKTAAAVAAITYEEVVDLVHSVDPAYRAGGNTRFMFNDLVLSALRKIRDDSGGAGTGMPMFQPSPQLGEPDTILGQPFSINNHMAGTIEASALVALFGDFSAFYVVRQVQGISVVRLTERYADYGQVGMFAWGRMDATKDDTAAVKSLVMAAS